MALLMVVSATVVAAATDSRATLAGKVVDESGGVIAGAKITIIDAEGTAVGIAVTDAGGQFAISSLLRAKYVIQAEQPQFAVSRVEVDLTATPLEPLRVTLRFARIRESVNVTAPGAYAAPTASVATKTDTPAMEVPASVQVLTQQVLQDQQATTLDQALVNASGVRASSIGWAENIYLRGFTTSTYLRNGTRIDDPSGLGGLATLSNVDSLEILKGPGSVLYGQLEPGGVVNILTKQPLAAPHYSVSEAIGSWEHSITSGDATGPITQDKTLLYRVNVAYDTANLWVDNVSDKRLFIAPTLQWRPTPRTQITFEASYSHDDSTIYQQQYVPYDTTSHEFLFGPKNSNPSPYYFDPYTTFVSISWSHEFNDRWSIKQLVSHNEVDFSTPLNLSSSFGPLAEVNDVWTVGLGSAQLSGKTRSDGTVLDVVGHFESGMAAHTVLAGADYYELRATYDSKYSNPNGPFAFVPLFSSTVIPISSVLGLDPNNFYSTDTTTKSYGIYLQDQVKLPSDIYVLGGLRYQNVSTSGSSNTGTDLGGSGVLTPNSPEQASAVTPRVGVLWRPRSWVSLYSSYTENFGATNASAGNDWQGRPLKPEGANQYEVGTKLALFRENTSVSVALFDLTKTNVLANDLAHPNPAGGFFPTTIGQIASKGLEVTLEGEVMPNWNLLAAYTYDHARVQVGTTSYPQGSSMPFVPRSMARLFTTYDFRRGGFLSGWKIGAGVAWEGAAPGIYVDPSTGATDTTTITSPSHQVYDAILSYERRIARYKATCQVNVRNLFDKSYYTDAFMYAAPWGVVTWGNPRAVMASVKVEM